MTPAIEIRGASKRFGTTDALKDISIDVRPARLTGLVGPDGAGKTTLMRLLAALMTPTEGEIRVAGLDVSTDAERIHRLAGYMPQRFGLYEDLTVQENLHLYADLRGLQRREAASRFERLLAFTGLAPFTGRLSGALSGGMKQKLGLACALMAQPQVLLLDEPSVGVDPVSRRELWRMVQDLAGEGMSVVWATAYLDEAERCEDVILLDEGEIVYAGAPSELTRRLAGRSFLVTGLVSDRREFLSRALGLPSVRDGVIQGAAVRLVLADTTPDLALDELVSGQGAQLAPVAPRFEDAFIDHLAGGAEGESAIAKQMDPVSTERDVMVSCRDLTRRFGDFIATDNISFEVRRGEVLGLLGPNGAGKSTTFKMLCGLLKPSAGLAEVVGLDLRRSGTEAKLQLGYMAQKFSLYGLLTVTQNLEFFSGIYGLRGELREQRMAEMIEIFHLQPYLDESPDNLPLGFKQRMALACALMHRPSVLFLDEPTSGVDPITRREFWTHITGLVRRGVTVLVTTHFMEEAEYCDRVALVNRARLIALDTPDALKARVAGSECPDPSMEDAFVRLVLAQDEVEAAEHAVLEGVL
jgi:ABC-2 type transport system ATP-binding protein